MEFVGRTNELHLVDCAAVAPGTRSVLVTGDPGCGKSRFLLEAVSSLTSRQVLWLRGYEPEALVPLAAANDLMKNLSRQDASLARLLAAEASTPLMSLFEAVYAALAAVVQPVVIVADDVQWLDATSRALLHYLVRAAQHDNHDVLLLAAARPSADVALWNESLTSLLGGTAVTEMDLGPLDRETGIAFVASIAPGLSDEVAERYWSTAAGSPFWLGLLAQHGGITATSSLIRMRLRTCSADGARTLGMLASAARPLADDALAALLRWPPERVAAATATLSDRGLATRRQGMNSVAHDLIRVAVAADLPAELREELHLRVAEWLAKDDDPAALLAAMRHRTEARQPVTDLALRAMASPRRQWLGAGGLAHIVSMIEDGTGPAVRVLVPQLAALATEIGEPALALRLWERVFDEQPHARERAIAAREAARAAYQLDEAPSAWRWMAQARGIIVDDPVATILLDVLEAHLLRWMDGRFNDAAASATRALSAARLLALPEHREVLVEALSVAYDDAMGRGDYDSISCLADEVHEVARGDADLEYTAALYRISAYLLQGDGRQAEPLARRYWRSATEAGHPARILQMAGPLLDALTIQGRVRESADVAERIAPLIARASDLGRRFSTGIALTNVLREVDHVQALTGDWRAAVDRIARDIADAGPHLGMTSAILAAELRLVLGTTDDVSKVLELTELGLAMDAEVGCPRCGEQTRLSVARIRALVGDVDGARDLLTQWQRHAEPNRPDVVQRAHRWAQALVTALDGSTGAAERELVELEVALTRRGNQLEGLWALLDLAWVLARVDPGRAIVVLEDAAQRSADMGATNVLAVAQRRQRQLGARAWRRGRSTGELLTEREHKVVELLATGATNPEIAAQLFLSRKTVERHVSNVIAKLGVRNRTEVAALRAGHAGLGGTEGPREFPDEHS